MKTHELLRILRIHQNKSLLFEYQPEQFVSANYHITEIKNATIEAVDCGTRTDSWKETIIQLWENPEEKDKTDYMSAFKALRILNKVDRIRTMAKDAEVKFEYGNKHFHSTQLCINDFAYNEKEIIFKLAAEKTTCKAQEKYGVDTHAITSETHDVCTSESGCC